MHARSKVIFARSRGGEEATENVAEVFINCPEYIHTYMHACMHACMHAYIHTYIHTYTGPYRVGPKK